ncbi:hypothetical protein HDU83_009766 [Entophlyctis luteolus]|nr:hypothetical protein HDU83_009766 [Entophlyctis luteolus]KAJ3390215.1 hypothetical protein HDU84_007785 [Entophlyctis sp. JEL0112]
MAGVVLTCVAPANVSHSALDRITSLVTQAPFFGAISSRKNLSSSSVELFESTEVTELHVQISEEQSVAALSMAAFDLANTLSRPTDGDFVNIVVQKDSVFRRNKRLVVFDMDSTLIEQEVIDEIARCCGLVDKVAKITESAMNGEIDFKESLARRVGLLKGAPVSVLDTVREKITFTPGAKELCKVLRTLGCKLAVISGRLVFEEIPNLTSGIGGFLPLANFVKNELGLDFAYANQLQVSPDGRLLEGKTFGPVVDGTRKAQLLDVIAQSCNVLLDQVVAVGDGANDLPMLSLAGLGVAFNAKPRVQEQARAVLNQRSLIYVLVLLGLSAAEISEALRA